MKKKDVFLTLIAIAALFGVACFVQTEMDSYIRRIVNLCLVYAIIGLSMNLTNGFVGQFSLGQAGFMAIGAYVVGIFTVPVELRPNVFYAAPMNPLIADIQMPLWLALIAGGLLAALVAFLIGTPVLRLRGDYLAVATLGFSEIIRIWITNAQSITNGALGIKDIPPLNDVRYIFLATAVTFIFIALLINSSYGRAFKAIREDEIASESVGVQTTYYKTFAFVLSAMMAGIAGCLYAGYLGSLYPSTFKFMKSIEILVMVVLGGMGSMLGSVISASVLTILPELLRSFSDYRMVVYSLALVIMMIFRPKGLLGSYDFSLSRTLEAVLNRIFRPNLVKKSKKEAAEHE